jgi:hypothetical protein
MLVGTASTCTFACACSVQYVWCGIAENALLARCVMELSFAVGDAKRYAMMVRAVLLASYSACN